MGNSARMSGLAKRRSATSVRSDIMQMLLVGGYT